MGEMRMKNALSLAVIAILGYGFSTMAAQPHKDVVDYVSPNIGGVGILLTSTIPYVQVPHGMSIWKREFWFSVAEIGEVYRVPLPA